MVSCSHSFGARWFLPKVQKTLTKGHDRNTAAESGKIRKEVVTDNA